jgi:hypothetical protein
MINELDTANIKAELRDYAARNYKTQKTIKKALESRLERTMESHNDCRWILRIISAAESGRELNWLTGQLEWLEYGAPAVQPHFINHAIALCKQAIANQTPALV